MLIAWAVASVVTSAALCPSVTVAKEVPLCTLNVLVVVSIHISPSLGEPGADAAILYSFAYLLTSAILAATVLTLAIEPPVRLTLATLVATVVTLALLVATVVILH